MAVATQTFPSDPSSSEIRVEKSVKSYLDHHACTNRQIACLSGVREKHRCAIVACSRAKLDHLC